ncbi:MAG: TonB-dependent receptor [Henriciella sp.]|nr:TonB-dependent receptor [Henriciella sp.]
MSSGGGNPLLRPYIADAIDLSFEYYFADGGGSVTAAAFRKDFDAFIDGSSTAIIDYASILPTLNLTPAVAAIPNVNLGSISGPANFSGGHLQGLEFSASVPADIFFEGPLSGCGVEMIGIIIS